MRLGARGPFHAPQGSGLGAVAYYIQIVLSQKTIMGKHKFHPYDTPAAQHHNEVVKPGPGSTIVPHVNFYFYFLKEKSLSRLGESTCQVTPIPGMGCLKYGCMIGCTTRPQILLNTCLRPTLATQVENRAEAPE